MIIYLLWNRPLKSKMATWVEVMNEETILMQIYLLLCFTDFVPREDTRVMIGFAYIGIFGLNILVHLVILVGSSCYEVYKWGRKRYFLYKQKKLMEEIKRKRELKRIIDEAFP
jgi:membrane associated rhomboid family serine protease